MGGEPADGRVPALFLSLCLSLQINDIMNLFIIITIHKACGSTKPCRRVEVILKRKELNLINTESHEVQSYMEQNKGSNKRIMLTKPQEQDLPIHNDLGRKQTHEQKGTGQPEESKSDTVM